MYECDAAELVVANMLDRHFAGGKHLMLSTDGRFWRYDGRVWRPASEATLPGAGPSDEFQIPSKR